jgi:hypothetical protein
MSIPNLHPSEAADFKNEVQRAGRSVGDFDVAATPQELVDQSGNLSLYRGTVTVRNRKTGISRIYDTGHASRWVSEFASDLKLGFLDADNVFVDASLPATLFYAGKAVHCPTVQEAVLEWMRLRGDDRDQATIRASDGTTYDARQIEHLHLG